MIESEFNADLLYNRIIRYYIDKKGYPKEQANSIAQRVVMRETERRICHNQNCRHMLDDHIRNSGTCLIQSCDCTEFKKQSGKGGSQTR